MEFIFQFFLFLLFCGACVISFYLPGKLVLSRVFALSPSKLSFFSWPVGLAMFLLGIYITAWIHLTYLYLLMLVGIFVYALIKERDLFSLSLKEVDAYSVGIIFIGSVIFWSLTAFSYLYTKNGLQFIGTTNVMDGLLHVAYTKSMLTTFPPNHAAYVHLPLRGYHYFYDLLMSRFALYYHFSPEDLYYRFFPIAISLLYGGGFYFLTKKITENRLSQRLVLFFAYFSQSFAFALSFFVHGISPISEFGSIYPLELILNPSIILSIGMLLCFVYLLMESHPKMSQMVLLGFLFGIITELKVYSGIIGVSVVATVIFLRIIKDRQDVSRYFIGLITMVVVIFMTYIPNNFGAGSLWFSPFFAYSSFMQDPPFTAWHWELRRIIFLDHHNIPRLILLYTQAIGLFWVLSLGSRIIFLFGFRALLKRTFWGKELHIAILVMILVPVVIGSLFVQSVSIFDTKQFFWIAGCLIAIPSGIFLGNFLQGKVFMVKLSIIGIIVFLSLGGIWGQLQNFVFHPQKYVIPENEVTFLQQIGSSLPTDAWITYIPEYNATPIMSDVFTLSPVIAALSGKPTYFDYEPESARSGMESVYDQRSKTTKALQAAIRVCNIPKIKKYFGMTGGSLLITINNKCLNNIATKRLNSQNSLEAYGFK